MMLRLSRPASRRTSRSLSRSRIRATPRQPGDRQDQPGRPQHLAPSGRIRQPLQAPVPAAAAAGIAISARSISCATNPNGSEGTRSIRRCRSKYEPRSAPAPSGWPTSTRKHRADRQVGPGEEPVLGGRQRPGPLEQPLAGDQPDQDGDQGQDGVLEHRERRGGRAGPPSGSPAASPPLAPHPAAPGDRRDASVPQGATASRSSAARWSPSGSAGSIAGSVGRVRLRRPPRRRVGSGGERRREPARGRLRLVGRLVAQARQDSPSRSRSARASSSRRTARCGGICSRNAVISPISSNAA